MSVNVLFITSLSIYLFPRKQYVTDICMELHRTALRMGQLSPMAAVNLTCFYSEIAGCDYYIMLTVESCFPEVIRRETGKAHFTTQLVMIFLFFSFVGVN